MRSKGSWRPGRQGRSRGGGCDDEVPGSELAPVEVIRLCTAHGAGTPRGVLPSTWSRRRGSELLARGHGWAAAWSGGAKSQEDNARI